MGIALAHAARTSTAAEVIDPSLGDGIAAIHPDFLGRTLLYPWVGVWLAGGEPPTPSGWALPFFLRWWWAGGRGMAVWWWPV